MSWYALCRLASFCAFSFVTPLSDIYVLAESYKFMFGALTCILLLDCGIWLISVCFVSRSLCDLESHWLSQRLPVNQMRKNVTKQLLHLACLETLWVVWFAFSFLSCLQSVNLPVGQILVCRGCFNVCVSEVLIHLFIYEIVRILAFRVLPNVNLNVDYLLV